MNIAQLLQRTALAYPERPAVLHGEEQILDYRELAERAAKLAGYFTQILGLSEGSRVALFMKNCPQYLEILYGAWWAGMVVVPVNAKLHPRELTYVLRNSQADCFFVTEDLAADVASAVLESELRLNVVTVNSTEYEDAFSVDPNPLKHRMQDDVAWLFYTSGTTGNPKGVMQTNRNLLAMAVPLCLNQSVFAASSSPRRRDCADASSIARGSRVFSGYCCKNHPCESPGPAAHPVWVCVSEPGRHEQLSPCCTT